MQFHGKVTELAPEALWFLQTLLALLPRLLQAESLILFPCFLIYKSRGYIKVSLRSHIMLIFYRVFLKKSISCLTPERSICPKLLGHFYLYQSKFINLCYRNKQPKTGVVCDNRALFFLTQPDV